MKDTIDLLNYEIYPNLDRAKVVHDLDPKDKGRYYLLTCPQCGRREAYLYKNGLYIKCNRLNKCGYSISLWDYIQTTKRLSNKETLKELAKLSGYTLPELTGYSEVKAKKIRERVNLLETALNYFKAQLWTNKGKEALEYLKDKRGYTETEIKDMELGFYPSQKEVEAYLVKKRYSKEAIKEAGLKTGGFGKTHKLVIPYRDPVGRLKGFSVRAIKEGVKDKYRSSLESEKDTLFNLNEARGEKDLIVTEGYLDALISTQRGIKGITAIGGSSITETQLENAIRYKVKSFILALDNDKAGQDGIEKSIKLINKKGLKSYVVTLPEGYDPDDLMREKRVEAFKKAINEAQSGVKWMAYRILSKYNLETDKGRDDALEESLGFEVTIKDPVHSRDFWDTITKTLEIPQEILETKIKDYHQKKEREQSKRDYEKLPPRYTFDDFEREIKESPEGLRTGYQNLDEFIRIPQGAITLIAGKPSHGKTTLLMNLSLKMANFYKDKMFFFFSYEENRKKIGLKILKILSGEETDKKQNNLERYIKEGNKSNAKIEDGKKKFREFTESGRLWIIDKPYYVDELTDTIVYLKKTYNNIGAIFIDYIQKVKIKERFDTRQIELQKISNQIMETAISLNIPIILGSQLNREVKDFEDLTLDKLREAGDLEQDASVVIGLYNEAKDKYGDDKEDGAGKVIELRLRLLKNRDAEPNREFNLFFNAPILKITEDSPSKKSPREWGV